MKLLHFMWHNGRPQGQTFVLTWNWTLLLSSLCSRRTKQAFIPAVPLYIHILHVSRGMNIERKQQMWDAVYPIVFAVFLLFVLFLFSNLSPYTHSNSTPFFSPVIISNIGEELASRSTDCKSKHWHSFKHHNIVVNIHGCEFWANFCIQS